MNNNIRHKFLLIVLILFVASSYGQESPYTNFFTEIKKYDLSTILTADSIVAEDGDSPKDVVKRAEPIGYIGDDYQRLIIRFISVIQNQNNKYAYFVYGKTKVNEKVRNFQGTITIKEASIAINLDFPAYKQGHAVCDVQFYEDKKLTSTGRFKGTMTIGFVIDENKLFRYDATLFSTDGFTNNEFSGQWISYKTNVPKVCSFGDYRFPDRGDLDIGASEFMPSSKYIKNGWSDYMINKYEDAMDLEKDRKRIKVAWWQ